MSDQETYPFRLFDGMMLLVGIGLGLAWMQTTGMFPFVLVWSHAVLVWSHAGEYYPDTVATLAQYLIPFLTTLSPCIVFLQLIHLRRTSGRFWRQAGTVACATAFAVLLSGTLIHLTHLHLAFLVDGQAGLARSPNVIGLESWDSVLDMSRGVGLSIAAIWAYMRATGVRERSMSVLDVMGKALGWAWILIALLPRQA
jgi:hypothetical protein